MSQIDRVLNILSRITASCLNKQFIINAEYDKKYSKFYNESSEIEKFEGRIYLQASYVSNCTKTGEEKVWKGRKNYLSSHMTDDEIVKTAYITFKQAVEHEVMEGFKVDNTILFNPHVNFESLLEVSNKEVKRESHLKVVSK